MLALPPAGAIGENRHAGVSAIAAAIFHFTSVPDRRYKSPISAIDVAVDSTLKFAGNCYVSAKHSDEIRWRLTGLG